MTKQGWAIIAITGIFTFLVQLAFAGWFPFRHRGDPNGTALSGADYSDIIAYHDCDDTDDMNKAGGVGTVTYDAGIIIATGPVGNSWDNNNDGYDDLQFAVDGNVDTDTGRIGFYFSPQDFSDGRLIWITTSTDDASTVVFIAVYLAPDDIQITFRGGTAENCSSTNLSLADWPFLEFKFNGENVTMYKNGAEVCTATGSGVDPFNTVHLFSSSGNVWDAHVDQFISSSNPNRDLNAVKDVINFD